MRVVLQRVSRAAVTVDGQTIGTIGPGFLLLVGFARRDDISQVRWMAEKIVSLRLFPDDQGKMNLNLQQVEGELLVVSQFTLYADARKGRRPSFVDAAPPDDATTLYEQFIEELTIHGVHVETGAFGAKMDVTLVNDGPVTLVLER